MTSGTVRSARRAAVNNASYWRAGTVTQTRTLASFGSTRGRPPDFFTGGAYSATYGDTV